MLQKLLNTGVKKIIIQLFLLILPTHSQAKAEEFCRDVVFFAVRVFISAEKACLDKGWQHWLAVMYNIHVQTMGL